MSSDDILCIIKTEDGYTAYREFLSNQQSIKELQTQKPVFTVPTLEDAILCAQAEDTEYGYYFYDVNLPVTVPEESHEDPRENLYVFIDGKWVSVKECGFVPLGTPTLCVYSPEKPPNFLDSTQGALYLGYSLTQQPIATKTFEVDAFAIVAHNGKTRFDVISNRTAKELMPKDLLILLDEQHAEDITTEIILHIKPNEPILVTASFFAEPEDKHKPDTKLRYSI